MGSFVKKFKVEDKEIEFNFVRIYTVTGVKFFISTFYQMRSILFTMEARNGSWQVIDISKVPQQILDLEVQLSAAIMESKPF